VRHGAAAAVSLRQQIAHAILMDFQVPMGGVKTARVLRLNPKYANIPIVLALPPNKDEARKMILQAQGLDLKHFLPKPFTMAALQQKMTQVLQEAKADTPLSGERIREEIRSLSNLPAMPATHNKLLQLLNKADDDVDINQVSETLKQDAALSTKVMRTCRSAFFGFQGNLMNQAVAFLEVGTIRQIVQSAIIYTAFADSEETDLGKLTMERLWQHSLATGMAMEIIGKDDKQKTHFLLGVLHDIGKAVMMLRFPEYYHKVIALVEKENCTIIQAETELLGITHADCGGELAVHWELPPEVRSAIAFHHQPSRTNQHKRLASMAHIADIAVHTMKIGYAGDDRIPEMAPYAKRLQKGIDEVIKNRDHIIQTVDTIMGGSSNMSDEEEETVQAGDDKSNDNKDDIDDLFG
jgi:HD-like signal output (HDOD) protein/CheY-like chemotaxis protein